MVREIETEKIWNSIYII